MKMRSSASEELIRRPKRGERMRADKEIFERKQVKSQNHN
jgi:hypothetical protein